MLNRDLKLFHSLWMVGGEISGIRLTMNRSRAEDRRLAMGVSVEGYRAFGASGEALPGSIHHLFAVLLGERPPLRLGEQIEDGFGRTAELHAEGRDNQRAVD